MDIDVRIILEEEINNLQYIYHGLDFGFAADPALTVFGAVVPSATFAPHSGQNWLPSGSGLPHLVQ